MHHVFHGVLLPFEAYKVIADKPSEIHDGICLDHEPWFVFDFVKEQQEINGLLVKSGTEANEYLFPGVERFLGNRPPVVQRVAIRANCKIAGLVLPTITNSDKVVKVNSQYVAASWNAAPVA
jgi:hypothetical protein